MCIMAQNSDLDLCSSKSALSSVYALIWWGHLTMTTSFITKMYGAEWIAWQWYSLLTYFLDHADVRCVNGVCQCSNLEFDYTSSGGVDSMYYNSSSRYTISNGANLAEGCHSNAPLQPLVRQEILSAPPQAINNSSPEADLLPLPSQPLPPPIAPRLILGSALTNVTRRVQLSEPVFRLPSNGQYSARWASPCLHTKDLIKVLWSCWSAFRTCIGIAAAHDSFLGRWITALINA